MKTNKSVAIIIVGTNEKRWLQRAITTVLSSDFMGRLEVIYVDNNSHDGSSEFVKTQFPSVHVVKNTKNLGFSKANNKGIRKALGMDIDYLFFLNPDTATPKGLISYFVNFMDQHSDFGAIGPLQTIYNKQYLETSISCLNSWSKQALINGDRHVLYMDFPGYRLVEHPQIQYKEILHVLDHAYVQGAALFIRTKIMKGDKWFDETYHTFYEEVDLCRKIKWQGFRVALLTNKFIQHQEGGSTRESQYKKKLMMRNKYYFVLTDPTFNMKQIKYLFKGWIKSDINLYLLKNTKFLFFNFFWVLFNLPRTICCRAKNKKISKNRFLSILKEKRC